MVIEVLRVAKIFRALESNSARTAKEGILSTVIQDDGFNMFLKMIYNPYITTKISDKKLHSDIGALGKEIFDIEEFIEFLSEESTGKHSDVATVKGFKKKLLEQAIELGLSLSEQNDVAWLIDGTICKSLKVGVTATTINKVYGKNYIPTFKVMLAEKYVDYDKKKNLEVENWRELEGKEVVGTLKIDGNRAEVMVENGIVKIFSREGKEIEGCLEIEQAMNGCPDGVYEGEMLALGDFKNANERFKKTSSIMRSKGEKKGLEFVVFDYVNIDSFKSGETFKASCKMRKDYVEKIIQSYTNSIFVRYLEPLFYGVFDKEKIEAIADQLKADGEEGLMVQSLDAPYEFKRVKHLLKVKSFETADIKCVDIYEGKSGKNIGRMGGIVCEYKGDKVNIGGGFDEQERIDYWENPSLIVGKIVEVKFFEEFLSEDGAYDLRFATFKTIREDKAEESYN